MHYTLVVIIVKDIFIRSFLFYCVLYNHTFQTNPNSITNLFKLFNYIAFCVAFFYTFFYRLKEKASLLLDQCDDEDEEEKITRDLENELDALENQANANKLHFQQQFTNDQQKQSDKMKARLQKKYNKKMVSKFKAKRACIA